MATKLTRPRTFDLGDIGLNGGDGGEYLVTLHPAGYIEFRRKRSRTRYPVSFAGCYRKAAGIKAERGGDEL